MHILNFGELCDKWVPVKWFCCIIGEENISHNQKIKWPYPRVIWPELQAICSFCLSSSLFFTPQLTCWKLYKSNNSCLNRALREIKWKLDLKLHCFPKTSHRILPCSYCAVTHIRELSGVVFIIAAQKQNVYSPFTSSFF